MQNEPEEAFMLSVERILALHGRMSDDEKTALSAWEKKNVTGDGRLATSDWPGWKAVVERLSH